MFHRILVPLDGSEHCVEALRAAVVLAQRTGAELLTLYVVPDSTDIEEATAAAEAQAEERVCHTVEELRRDGVRVNMIFGSGRLRDGILTAIWEQHPALVVLAPKNRRKLEALSHPSTTHALITYAHEPLLIWPDVMNPQMREEWLTSPHSAVIVPLDGSGLAERAIPAAETFAYAFDRPLLLFRVIPPLIMYGTGPHVARFERQAIATEEHNAHRYLRDIRRNLARTSRVPIRTLIGAGDPSTAILDLANANPGSLIAMSTHGRSGFARFLLGSETFEVLHRTSVPLLIVPPHQYAFAPKQQAAKEQAFSPDSSLALGSATSMLADIDGNTRK